MAVNENAKTLAVIIAILLIPLGVLAWNYYESRPQVDDEAYIPEDIDFEDLEDEEITDGIIPDGTKPNPTSTPAAPTPIPTVKPTSTPNDKVDSIVDGGKVLPNTSSNPVE